MAITVTSPQSKYGFIKNAVSADASGCEEIIGAPATGLSIKIRHLTINSGAAITITLGAGETGPGSVTTALLGPITFTIGMTLQWNFNPPLILPAATSLTVDASGAGAVCVFAQGVIE
jgi:hypothetical protein